MKRFRNVDFIVRGEAEVPLLSLMKELSKDKPDFSSVPNLTWRNNNRIIHNRHSYVADEADLNRLNFSNFKLMKNFSIYSKVPSSVSDYSKDLLLKYNTFYLCTGRGCSVNCTFCGGSRLSQQIINRRNRVVYRSHKDVLETIKDATRAGIDCLCVSFDPTPDRKYYIDLFRLIRNNKINISMEFECWSLPSFGFIDEFGKTFRRGRYSKLFLSPETGSERLRKRHKGFFYTNRQLLEVIQYLKKEKIFTEVYFSYPLPYETAREANTTRDFIRLIKRRMGGCGKIYIQDFGFDPASPIFIYPKKYKIIKIAKTFFDYCDTKNKRRFLIKGLNEQKFNSRYKRWLKI